MKRNVKEILLLATFVIFAAHSDLSAQEKLTVSYSSVDAPSANWYIAQEKGLYKKYGMDVESIFIPASSTNVAVLVAGQLKFGNGTGGTIASAAVGGANLVAVACFMNTLPYELIVQESIKNKEQLKGKSVGISRIGSSSDVIARVFLKHLGLEPDKDVAILQVGGSGERAAAFRTGRIAAFPAPPGVIHLTKGMPQRVLVSTADFPKPYPFPYICGTTTRSYLATNRATVKRLVMALTEGVHFFKTRKEESKKILAKYSRHDDETYLEAAYQINAKLFDRVPYVTREGMDIQLKDALSKKPGSTTKVDDIVDDTIVAELEKEGFIDKLYRQ
ncbi:MAG TPA: ABC transporter substrate-binding protein [Candidatus Limnocylindria bacterium]|nr:ABC transporter substrate-binding protein [Candidatus Limnocylindria bacterium]